VAYRQLDHGCSKQFSVVTATQKAAHPGSQTFKTSGGSRERFFWLAFALYLLAFSPAAAAESRFVPGRILVKTKAGLSEARFARKLSAHRAVKRQSPQRAGAYIVTVAETDAEAALAALQTDPEIEFAERDYIAEAAYVPNDPYVASGAEWHLAQIDAGLAWNYTVGLDTTVVAILDSGVNVAHPDLDGQFLPGFDFVNCDADPADDFGHGTAVSGMVIAAGNNGLGVAGVAFGARALPVKVMDSSGFAVYSCIAQGIRYAVDQGARVINLSLVGNTPSQTLQDAIDYAWSNNVVVVAAAGNNASAVPKYPAACNHVVAVSATDADDSLAPFSNYGSHLSLAAPGDGIWTTQADLSRPYGSWRGTSLASPIVAGVAALVASANPSLSNAQIVSILEQTADDLGSLGYDVLFGYGRVNASSAVAAASREPGALPPWTPPGSDAGPNAPSAIQVVWAPLVVQTNGWGKVSPHFDGKLLEIGRVYTVKAVPGPGQVFAGWNGAESASPILNFTMQSNLTLTANFVPTPFPTVRGSYAGLTVHTDGISPDNSGSFTLKVTSLGQFTGKLRLAGRSHGFRGRFDLAGDAIVTVKRGRLQPLALTLHVDLTNSEDQVTGSITDGTWTSGLGGGRNVFDAKLNPVQQAGSHAFILEQAGDPAVSAASGSSAIAAGGKTRVKGRLADGRAFSTSTTLSRNGDCPFHLSLGRGREIVIGWLNFPSPPASAPNGFVLWVRTGTNAFAAMLKAASAL
jgi:uncharacterized repeat protein (TIGR02543 family)